MGTVVQPISIKNMYPPPADEGLRLRTHSAARLVDRLNPFDTPTEPKAATAPARRPDTLYFYRLFSVPHEPLLKIATRSGKRHRKPLPQVFRTTGPVRQL